MKPSWSAPLAIAGVLLAFPALSLAAEKKAKAGPKEGNAARIDAVFARFAQRVKIEAIDRAQGSFVIRFLPFTPSPGAPQGMGFNFGHIAHPISDPAPKGMGLRILQATEGSLARPAAAAKKKAKS